jgi:hypothetical protein
MRANAIPSDLAARDWHSRVQARRIEGHAGMVGTGIANLGRAALVAHPLCRDGPRRQGFALLAPMHNTGFVTPIQQPGHRPAMGSGGHIGAHGLHAVPGRHGPEHPFAIRQKRTIAEALSGLNLSPGLQRQHGEPRQEANSPDAQPRDTDEAHHSFPWDRSVT